MAKEIEDLPQGDDLAALLDEERKASSGKDKKITLMARELEALRAERDELAARVEGRVTEDHERREKIIELGSAVAERERDLQAREAALQRAIAEGLPVALVMKDYQDVEGWVEQLKAFRDNTIRASKPATGAPSYRPQQMQRRHIKGMSVRELSAVPLDVLDRLSMEDA